MHSARGRRARGGGLRGGDARPVTVYAAASLRDAFPAIDTSPRYNFAGSNQLQTQIERGAPADVFASASAKEPQALLRRGPLLAPVAFASNAIVLIVPAGNPGNVTSLESLTSGPRRRLAVGTKDVPVGKYTRELLETAGADAILTRNTVSNEANVSSLTVEGRARVRGRRLRLQHRRALRRRPRRGDPPARRAAAEDPVPAVRGPQVRGRSRRSSTRSRPTPGGASSSARASDRRRAPECAPASPHCWRSAWASSWPSWRSRSSPCSRKCRWATSPACCVTRRCRTR